MSLALGSARQHLGSVSDVRLPCLVFVQCPSELPAVLVRETVRNQQRSLLRCQTELKILLATAWFHQVALQWATIGRGQRRQNARSFQVQSPEKCSGSGSVLESHLPRNEG